LADEIKPNAGLLDGEQSEFERRIYNAKHGLADEARGGNLAERNHDGELCDALGANYDDPDADKPLIAVEEEPVALSDLLECQGYDPRQHVEVPEGEPFRVPPADADKMLEIWYLYETVGELKTAKLMESIGGTGSPYEALAAARYVEGTPGFNREIVMFGQATRGEHDPWARWYGRWPDSRQLAHVIYETFRAALAQRLIVQPFRVRTTPIYTPDHLDHAERANPSDPESRNKKWKERLREQRSCA
jgi:hypothetical protein